MELLRISHRKSAFAHERRVHVDNRADPAAHIYMGTGDFLNAAVRISDVVEI